LHPAWTYMLRDAGGSLWGTLVFALALVTPGYCAGWWLDVCRFRSRGLREQMAWSVALSFGVGTLPLVGLVWLGGIATGEVALVSLGVMAAVIFCRQRPDVDVSRREFRTGALVAMVWIAIVEFSLIDVGLGTHLWMSVTSYDHGLRTAFVDAVMRTGVPTVNPLYWPGHDVTLRYYYFWYVTCGVVARLAHISARQALIASCVWPLFGVVSMLALFGRYLLAWRGIGLRRRWWISVALLSVTGLDIFVAVFNGLSSTFQGDMEWWSIDHVASWADTFLWVPHHAAALICGLLTMLMLWLSGEEPLRKERLKLALIAGLSLASAFGLSTYVAVATGLLMAIWVCLTVISKKNSKLLTSALLATFFAALILTPYLAQLLHHEAGTNSSVTQVLGFGIRQMLDPELLQGVGAIRRLQVNHPFGAAQLVAALLLIPGYAIEFGFFAVVLVLMQRGRPQKSDGEKTLLLWTWIGLAASTFLRSRVIATNDYGLRAILLPQFLLLPLAVGVVERSSGWLRRILLGLAVIGVCGSVYQIAMLRTFLPWHEKHEDPLMADLSQRNNALRDAYSALGARISPAAHLQFGVSDGGYFTQSQMLQVNHQVITEEKNCNLSFGGEPSACIGIQEGVGRLFPPKGRQVPSASDARTLCNALGVDVLVATRWDNAWQTPGGWVWHLPLLVERPEVRIVACELTSH